MHPVWLRRRTRSAQRQRHSAYSKHWSRSSSANNALVVAHHDRSLQNVSNRCKLILPKHLLDASHCGRSGGVRRPADPDRNIKRKFGQALLESLGQADLYSGPAKANRCSYRMFRVVSAGSTVLTHQIGKLDVYVCMCMYLYHNSFTRRLLDKLDSAPLLPTASATASPSVPRRQR